MSLDDFRRESVRVGDATLAVFRRGSGRAFYWNHGFASGSEQEAASGLRLWSELGEGWEVVLLDSRGHGASSPETDPAKLRWDNLGRDLLAVADALGHERFVVGGVSMGAGVALHAAVAAPERVDGLVLMIPPTAWETRAAQADRYRADAELASRGDIEGLIAAAASEPVPPLLAGTFDPAEAARARYSAIDLKVLAAIMGGAAESDLPERAMISRLQVPTLILAWDGDDGHPWETAQRLAELLPGAELNRAEALRDLRTWPVLARVLCGA